MQHPLIHEFVNELPPIKMELVKMMRIPQPDANLLISLGLQGPSIRKTHKKNKTIDLQLNKSNHK